MPTRSPRRVAAAAVATTALLAGCASAHATAVHGTAVHGTAVHAYTAQPQPAPKISLGRGFLHFPSPASTWVAAHPSDPRAAAIGKRIAAYPSALWLTGDESFGNLREAVSMANRQDRTMLLTIYDIPLRYDGLSSPTSTTLAQYEAWVRRIAKTIGRTRAVITLEPDALWFYDRMDTDAQRKTRLVALRYAIGTLAARAPRTRVYIDAGTSSGSVTPQRMAALLVLAGVTKADGYAVNVSSFAPQTAIQRYARLIRASLQSRGVKNPRYIVDTGRNGAASWNTDWCNPSGQRLGTTPRVVRGSNGLDLDVWVKQPGTSDGDCGAPGEGAGSYGGQFLPAVAYRMITG